MKNSFSAFYGIFITISAAVILTSCETDVDLNAPYDSTTVIFALLDADINNDGTSNALDTQWIKINRTYLGDGDNRPYAEIRDSSEYEESDFISKKVQRYSGSNLSEEWDLTAVTVSNKDVNGIFYGPEQTLYYFVPSSSGLDEESTYKLVLDFANKGDVFAETNIINGSMLTFQQPQMASTISMASGTAFNINYQENVQIKWFPAPGAKTYDAVLRFHFTEITYTDPTWTNPVDTTVRFVDFNAGSVKVEDVETGEMLQIEFNGESFFNYLNNKLVHSNNIRRVIGFYDGNDTRCFDVILSLGNDELNTYIEVNSPVSGIVQERPTYGNVSNALGLFAARSTRMIRNLRLIGNSAGGNPQVGNLLALTTGAHTQELNFCDPNPNSVYACE